MKGKHAPDENSSDRESMSLDREQRVGVGKRETTLEVVHAIPNLLDVHKDVRNRLLLVLRVILVVVKR